MAGMPFELTRADIAAFFTAVPNAAADVESSHLGDSGNPELDWTYGGNIPRYGRAYKWGGRYILVSMDAKFRWHFVDITDMASVKTIIQNANAPAYFSPPGNVYAEIFGGLLSPVQNIVDLPRTILENVNNAIKNALTGLQDEAHRAEYILLALILAALVVLALAVWRVKSFNIPGLSVTGGA